MRYCKGVCSQVMPSHRHLRIYDLYGRCTVCETWVPLPAVRCSCCSTILRTKPKRSSNRKKYILKDS